MQRIVALLMLVGPLAPGLLKSKSLLGETCPQRTASALDSLQVIGQFEEVPSNLAVFGDSDHDGTNEIIITKVSPSFSSFVRILEFEGNGHFEPVFDGPGITALAIGDADQDGKTDLVGLGAESNLMVFEGFDEKSHPSILVWQSSAISNQVGFAAIADTDADGRLEIVYLFSTGLSFRVAIFECDGDNRYVQRFISPLPLNSNDGGSTARIYNPWAGDELVWDLDRDGRPEIAYCGSGWLRVIESTADDAWEEIFSDSTGLVGARILTGGADTDRDGVQELFLGGDDWTTFERKVLIYQPTSDRTFNRVGTLTAFDGQSGEQWGALARTEPQGAVRFIWAIYEQLRIFSATSPRSWDLDVIVPDPLPPHLAVYAYDLNRNGRDEIYWLTDTETRSSLILERPTLPTDASVSQRIQGAIWVAPSPSDGDASVFLDPAIAVRAVEWSAFDAAGRLVFRQSLTSNLSRASWAMPVHRLRPGLYFLRVTDATGQPIATGKTVVLR